MVVVDKIDPPFALGARKKLGKATLHGEKRYAQVFYGEEEVDYGSVYYGTTIRGKHKYAGGKEFYGIYQRRKGINGQITVRSNFYIPSNPRTVPQQANRSTFADAVSFWQGLTEQQKEEYNKRVAHKNLSGYNLCIQEYLSSN